MIYKRCEEETDTEGLQLGEKSVHKKVWATFQQFKHFFPGSRWYEVNL